MASRGKSSYAPVRARSLSRKPSSKPYDVDEKNEEKREMFLSNCSLIYDHYTRVMNNMENKNEIVRKLFSDIGNDSFFFMGSYVTYPPPPLGDKLNKHYKDRTDAKIYEDTFEKMKTDLKDALKNRKNKYICFILGSIIDIYDVSHHLAFIYSVDSDTLRILDPGLRSWDVKLVRVIMNLCDDLFKKELGKETKYINTYSNRFFCSSCWLGECNPQDVTRGGWSGELSARIYQYTGFYQRLSVNRESYCQSWSILLLLTDVEQIIRGELDFDNPLMKYWDQEKSDLEICIRRFILWIVKQNSYLFNSREKDYYFPNFLRSITECFKDFNNKIEVPNKDDVICDDNLKLF